MHSYPLLETEAGCSSAVVEKVIAFVTACIPLVTMRKRKMKSRAHQLYPYFRIWYDDNFFDDDDRGHDHLYVWYDTFIANSSVSALILEAALFRKIFFAAISVGSAHSHDLR